LVPRIYPSDLKRSQAQASQRLAIFPHLFGAKVQRNLMLRGKLHEAFDWHVAKLGGAA